MARTKAEKLNVDHKQHWICEDCGRPNIGPNPPDNCKFCLHTFFDNLWDMIARHQHGNRGVQA